MASHVCDGSSVSHQPVFLEALLVFHPWGYPPPGSDQKAVFFIALLLHSSQKQPAGLKGA